MSIHENVIIFTNHLVKLFFWINLLIMLLKNVFKRFILIKYKKNKIFTITIWKTIDFMNISKSIDSMNEINSISKMNLIDSIIFASNCIELSKCWNIFNWSMFFVNFVKISKLINNFLNSMTLYRDFDLKMKTYKIDLMSECVIFSSMKQCLKTLLVNMLMIIINFESFNALNC